MHLVQQHGIELADIFVRAPGTASVAGTRAAGADVESGHPGVEKHGKPELAGPIEVSVECDSRPVDRRALGPGKGRRDVASDGMSGQTQSGAYLNVGRSFRASLVAPGMTILRSMVFSCW